MFYLLYLSQLYLVCCDSVSYPFEWRSPTESYRNLTLIPSLHCECTTSHPSQSPIFHITSSGSSWLLGYVSISYIRSVLTLDTLPLYVLLFHQICHTFDTVMIHLLYGCVCGCCWSVWLDPVQLQLYFQFPFSNGPFSTKKRNYYYYYGSYCYTQCFTGSFAFRSGYNQ